MKKTLTRFSENDLKQFEPEAKVGLIATINQEGLPHITLITALQAKTPDKLIWGQFSEGQSKQNVKTNPKTGFLIMTLDRSLWRGKALWTHQTTHGEDYEMFNNKPMFRYNAYFGIHTVHYMDLIETYGKESLPLLQIGLGSILTKAAKSAARQESSTKRILKPWPKTCSTASMPSSSSLTQAMMVSRQSYRLSSVRQQTARGSPFLLWPIMKNSAPCSRVHP